MAQNRTAIICIILDTNTYTTEYIASYVLRNTHYVKRVFLLIRLYSFRDATSLQQNSDDIVLYSV